MPDTVGWSQHDSAWSRSSGVGSLVATAGLRTHPGRAFVLGTDEVADPLWLAGHGWQVTTVSADALAVSRLSATAAMQDATIEAIVADPLSYQPHGQFELIVISYLEVAWSPLRRMLARLASSLAEGGHLIVVGVDVRNLDSGFGGPANPDLLSAAGQLADLLASLDLRVLNSEIVRREVVVEVGVRYALDHLVEAVRSTAA